MFKDPNIKALWDKNYQVMQEAYFQMHKASSRKYWKLGLFRKKYSAEEYKQLKESGASRYILKFETSNEQHHKFTRPTDTISWQTFQPKSHLPSG